MKHLKYFIFRTLIAFLLAFSFCFAACSDISDENESNGYSETSIQEGADSARVCSEDSFLITD
ncbi:MAG: hypothetical protein IJ530_08745 [Treponema sp.]|uniref:hypothetical protein n=1 Tax=Treponema sp. TaxID=166 RepID=UPI0025F6C71F|nr:hypothetical protein [Treponema sp.]MBQ8679840.1 hypothetical protein [Treponema sp.]